MAASARRQHRTNSAPELSWPIFPTPKRKNVEPPPLAVNTPARAPALHFHINAKGWIPFAFPTSVVYVVSQRRGEKSAPPEIIIIFREPQADARLLEKFLRIVVSYVRKKV